MRAVVQRVSHARVTADGSVTGEIMTGLLILLGVGRDDTSAVAAGLAERIANLRIFEERLERPQSENFVQYLIGKHRTFGRR